MDMACLSAGYEFVAGPTYSPGHLSLRLGWRRRRMPILEGRNGRRDFAVVVEWRGRAAEGRDRSGWDTRQSRRTPTFPPTRNNAWGRQKVYPAERIATTRPPVSAGSPAGSRRKTALGVPAAAQISRSAAGLRQ